MGARESRAQGEEADNAAGPPDYYALLEVDESATADEIKVRRHFLSFVVGFSEVQDSQLEVDGYVAGTNDPR